MAAIKDSGSEKEEFLMTREFREKKKMANYVKFSKVTKKV